VSLESTGIIRALNYFVEDTQDPAAKAFLVAALKGYWNIYEKYCPRILAELASPQSAPQRYQRWAVVAPALAHGYAHTGDKVWLERARKAWAMSFRDLTTSDSVLFPYKYDNEAYALYVEYCPEYLPFLDAETSGQK
jgi:hypothetical protein